MKNSSDTLLELVAHIVSSHPDLAPRIDDLITRNRKRNPADINFLLGVFGRSLANSKSQLRQDLFVLSQLEFKRGGFFVEFGATNGIDLSNSYLLEMEYGWNGILAEPAKCWHEHLRRNRNCAIETDCVWSESGVRLSFNEAPVPELATLDQFSAGDHHAKSRENGTTYEVNTISLNDLLGKYHAPAEIDYLSIDTEGSEFTILKNLDYSRYRFKIITCEHNFTPMRANIFELLTSQGYSRVFEDLSSFDDWYVDQTRLPR